MLFAQLTLGVTKSDGGAGTFRGGEPPVIPPIPNTTPYPTADEWKWVGSLGYSYYYAFIGAYCYEAVSAIPLSPFDKIYAQASSSSGERGPLTPVSNVGGGFRFCADASNPNEEGIPLGGNGDPGGKPKVRFYRESVNCITSIPLSSL